MPILPEVPLLFRDYKSLKNCLALCLDSDTAEQLSLIKRLVCYAPPFAGDPLLAAFYDLTEESAVCDSAGNAVQLRTCFKAEDADKISLLPLSPLWLIDKSLAFHFYEAAGTDLKSLLESVIKDKEACVLLEKLMDTHGLSLTLTCDADLFDDFIEGYSLSFIEIADSVCDLIELAVLNDELAARLKKTLPKLAGLSFLIISDFNEVAEKELIKQGFCLDKSGSAGLQKKNETYSGQPYLIKVASPAAILQEALKRLARQETVSSELAAKEQARLAKKGAKTETA